MQLKTEAVVALLALICAITSQVAAAHSHHHDQQAASNQQQVESGKIISPAGASLLNRPARHAHDKIEYIELSHPLHNGTIHWPRNKGIQVFMDIDATMKDPRNGSYHVRSDSINMAIHVGTHLDAPSHFGKNSWTVEKIPLERLIDVPVTVVDLSAKVKANRSYSFLKEDFLKNGKSIVEPNSIVLVYTGISQKYDDGPKSYLGTDKVEDITTMKSAGFSEEAAQFLVSQKVFGVGLDAVSADSSERQSVLEHYDPVAHVTFNENNIFILENINKNLEKLVGKSSARLIIAPLPVVGGTGSPVRLVASLGHDDCHCNVSNGSADQERSLMSYIILLISTCVLFIMV